jgi:hypothetical protein
MNRPLNHYIKPLDEELSKHSDEEVEFLVTMFKWFDDFLDQSKKKMEEHHKKGY